MSHPFITFSRKRPSHYRGITIHADQDLHEQAFALCRQFFPGGCSVLDLGAGAGAFSRRLADAGFRVTALDVDPAKWAVPEVRFLQLDLDRGVAASVAETFTAACCLEVIEHVENPWQLFRDLGRLVTPGGFLVLSTPNVTSFLSRWNFLRKGRFHQFDDADLAYGHISPITSWELEHAAQRCGWRLRAKAPGGYLPLIDATSLHPRHWVHNFARLACHLLAQGDKRGWCLLFVFERTAGNEPHG